MNPEKQPIGVFDSGLGGLTIWNEIRQLLPGEDTLYLADSINAPYGERSGEEILRLSRACTEQLIQWGAKIIVVACNTATTNAIEELRKSYNIPFIGIEPAIKPAGLHTKTGTIGVLATRGTLSSALFHKTAQKHLDGIRIVEQFGDGIVPLIEQGEADSEAMHGLLSRYLTPIREAGADHLVLGCSHYPLLIPQIRKYLPESVAVIDSGLAVARQTRAVLESQGLLNERSSGGAHKVYTSGDPEILRNFLTHYHWTDKVETGVWKAITPSEEG